jgi:hypothetical protein
LRGLGDFFHDDFGFGFGRRRRNIDRVADIGLRHDDLLAIGS